MNPTTQPSFTYGSIVLAYDGSHDGRKALCEGAELARLCNATTYLLAVMRIPLGVSLGETYSSETMVRDAYEEAERVLRQGIDELTGRGVKADGRLRQGEPITEIANLAREVDADLIVVGHHHRDGVSRWWHNPTGATLLDAVSCSVLVACSAPCN